METFLTGYIWTTIRILSSIPSEAVASLPLGVVWLLRVMRVARILKI